MSSRDFSDSEKSKMNSKNPTKRMLIYESWEKSWEKAKVIVWNGPMGIYEHSTFKKGTQLLAKAISKQENCTTIIGGGDSIAAIKELNLSNKFNHVSTGGGATLSFLENSSLPSIDAITPLAAIDAIR